jgi:hypothetical protein
MNRSRVLVTFLAALLFALTARSAPAQETPTLDAIGTLDYARGRSIVKVGSWVTYHMKARSEMGVTDDYTVTVLIAGEEEWWGEECFWVETWTQRGQGPEETAATLMSTAIFDDSLAARHTLAYQRKRVAEIDENGQPLVQTMRLGESEIRSRTPPDRGLQARTDTLGTDTLKTALGDFVCLKVRTEQGMGTTAQSADSSQYTEIRDVRVVYLTPQIPVTGRAREEHDYSISRRSWLVGRSQESGPLRVMDRSKGVLELVGYGTHGVEAKLIPVEFRRSLAEQRAAQAPKPRAPAAKPRPRTR